MTLKGFGLAAGFNTSIPELAGSRVHETPAVSTTSANSYVRPAKSPSVLVIGLSRWTTGDLHDIQDSLARYDIRASTFRPDEGLTIGDVIHDMSMRNGVLLVCEDGERQSWTDHNRRKIEAGAEKHGIRIKVLSGERISPTQAADAAAALVRNP